VVNPFNEKSRPYTFLKLLGGTEVNDKERLQEIKERLNAILFELKMGKTVEFTSREGLDMAWLIVQLQRAQVKAERYEEALKKIEKVHAPYFPEDVQKMRRIAREALDWWSTYEY
jgi:hypothetical protein